MSGASLAALLLAGCAGPVPSIPAPAMRMPVVNQTLSPTPTAGVGADDDVVRLAPFQVAGSAPDIWGFGILPSFAGNTRFSAGTLAALTIVWVIPNTAAAKAGLRPGEEIVASEGIMLVGLPRGKAFDLWSAKVKTAIAGEPVKWKLSVRPAKSPDLREAVLELPTKAPRWGAAVFAPPEGRAPVEVAETGPLVEKARIILGSGVWVRLEPGVALRGQLRQRGEVFLGYAWQVSLPEESNRIRGHHFFVSRQRGQTDIVLHTQSIRGNREKWYLTSPDGVLRNAYVTSNERPAPEEIEPTEAQREFRQESDLWLNRVGKVSSRWPLELIPRASLRQTEATR